MHTSQEQTHAHCSRCDGRCHSVPSPACGGGTGRGHTCTDLNCLPPPRPSSRSRIYPTSAAYSFSPNSGQPEFGCKRGREQAVHSAPPCLLAEIDVCML